MIEGKKKWHLFPHILKKAEGRLASADFPSQWYITQDANSNIWALDQVSSPALSITGLFIYISQLIHFYKLNFCYLQHQRSHL